MIHPTPITKAAIDVEAGDVIFDKNGQCWRKVLFVSSYGIAPRIYRFHVSARMSIEAAGLVIVGFEEPS